MVVSALSQTQSSPAAQSVADKSKKSLAQDFDNFLVLLTAQLRNQDPTTPLDTNQFTQQLVSFAGVEQSVNANKNLEKIIQMSEESQINSAVAYLGNVVEVDGNVAELKNGQTMFGYELPQTAKNVFVSITDKNGQTVFSGQGATTPGKHNIVWNGLDRNQRQLPDGTYNISVTALDEKDNTINTQTTITGQVDGVSMKDGQAVLSIGELEFTTDRIRTIKAPSYAYLTGQEGNQQDSTSQTQ